MRWIVVAVICSVTVAYADDKPNLAAMRKALDEQLFGKLFDGQPPMPVKDYVGVFPGSFDRPDMDVARWRMGPPYVGTIKIENSVAGWSGTWGWIAADLSVTQRPYTPSDGGRAKDEKHRYHLVEVFALDAGTLKLAATLLTDTLDDAKLPAVEHVPGGPPANGSLLSQLVSPGKATLLANAAVLGSSAAEVGLGDAAAKKLLASWSKLDLSIVANPAQKELVRGDLGIAVAEVDLFMNKASRRLRAIVVAKKVGSAWQVAALAFGPDSSFGDPKIP